MEVVLLLAEKLKNVGVDVHLVLTIIENEMPNHDHVTIVSVIPPVLLPVIPPSPVIQTSLVVRVPQSLSSLTNLLLKISV